MIQLSDNIIKYFNSLTKKELTIYLMFARYITEKSGIPLDHLPTITHQTELEFSCSIARLVEQKLIVIEQAKENVQLKDQLSGKSTFFTLKNKNRTGGEQHYIYNIINKYKESKSSKGLIGLKRQERNIYNITLRFKRVLDKIYNLDAKRRRVELVNYFADELNSLYGRGVIVTPEWRRAQISCAVRILKDHNFSLGEWKAAISYFVEQEYWKDKLKSLKQVEANIHQYVAKHKKKAKQKRVRVIK